MSAFQLPDAPGHILAASHQDGGHAGIRRAEALRLRDQWASDAVRAAAGDDAAAAQVTMISSLLEWAATSEERRNEIRERYLALARAWAAAGLLPFATSPQRASSRRMQAQPEQSACETRPVPRRAGARPPRSPV